MDRRALIGGLLATPALLKPARAAISYPPSSIIRRVLPATSNSSASGAGTDTTHDTWSIPAGFFATGQSLVLRYRWTSIGGTGPGSLLQRLLLDGSTALFSPLSPGQLVVASLTVAGWIELHLSVIAAGVSGQIAITPVAPPSSVGSSQNTNTVSLPVTVDTTIAHTLVFVSQWNTAGTTPSTFRLDEMVAKTF
jgi:hypothetical protein